MDLELKIKRLLVRIKEYEEELKNEGLGFYCKNCGDFMLNHEFNYDQDECESCIEKEDQMTEWRKSRI